jgi:hypothetical protein
MGLVYSVIIKLFVHVNFVFRHLNMASPEVAAGGDALHMCGVAAMILQKRSSNFGG